MRTALFVLLFATAVSAATYKGKSLDGLPFNAELRSTETVQSAVIRFNGKTVVIKTGKKTFEARLVDEKVTDLQNIEATSNGTTITCGGLFPRHRWRESCYRRFARMLTLDPGVAFPPNRAGGCLERNDWGGFGNISREFAELGGRESLRSNFRNVTLETLCTATIYGGKLNSERYLADFCDAKQMIHFP